MHAVLQMSSSPKSPMVPDQPTDSPIATPVPKRKKVENGSSSFKTPSVPDQPSDSPIGTPVPKQIKLENESASSKSPRIPDHPFVSPTAYPVLEKKKVHTGFDGKMAYNCTMLCICTWYVFPLNQPYLGTTVCANIVSCAKQVCQVEDLLWFIAITGRCKGLDQHLCKSAHSFLTRHAFTQALIAALCMPTVPMLIFSWLAVVVVAASHSDLC